MTRWLASALGAIALFGGCAFEDGDPWGHAEVSLEALFAPPDSRLDDQGRLVTTQAYAVRIDRLELVADALTLQLAGSGGATFDPANPPPGYSLCHNGHCHAEDGSLPTYEAIAAELAGGSGGPQLTLAASAQPLTLGSAPLVIPLECPGECELPRGEVVTATLSVLELRIAGTAFDTLDARLEVEGRDLDFVVDLRGTPIQAPVRVMVGRGQPLFHPIHLTLEVPSSLFDGIEFATEQGPLGPLVASNLTASGPLSAD